MAENLGTAVLKLRTDSSQFDKGISQAQGKAQKLGNKMKDIGGTLSKSISLPLAAAGAASVKWASELEESMNAVDVMFGSVSGSIKQFGENAVQNVGLAQSEFNQLSTSIGALLKQSGMDMEQVSQQTINLTKRAADLASVYDTDVKQAANALGSALRGEVEPARRFGINIGQAAIKSHALAEGLIESGEEMSQQQKIQARLSLMMKQSDTVAGDFQNTINSLANSTKVFTKNVKNTAAEFGKNLMPTVKSVVGVLNSLVNAFGDLSGASQRVIAVVATLTATIPPLVAIVGAAIVAFGSMATIITGGVLVAVAALTAAAIAIIENWEPIKGFFADLWGSVKNIFNDFIQWMRNVFIGAWNTYIEIIQSAIGKILDVAGTVGGALGFDVSGIEKARQKIAEAADQLKGVKNTNDQVNESFADGRTQLERVNQKAREQNDIRKIQHDLTKNIRKDQEGIADAAKNTTDQMKAQKRLQEAYREQWKEVNNNWRDLGEKLQFNRVVVDRIAETGKLTNEQKRQELTSIKDSLQLNGAMLEQAEEFPETNDDRLKLLERIKSVMEGITDETKKQLDYELKIRRNNVVGSGGFAGGMQLPGTQLQRAPGTNRDRTGMLEGLIGNFNEFSGIINTVAGEIDGLNQLLNWQDTIIKSLAETIAPTVEKAIKPLVVILKTMGEVAGKLLLPMLKILANFIVVLAEAWMWAYNNVFRHIYNGFIMLFNGIYNFWVTFVRGIINLVNKIPFVNVNKPGYRSLGEDTLDKISVDGQTGDDQTEDENTLDKTSIEQARPINITINISDNELAGEDGFRDLAIIIRNELESAGVINA